MVYTEWPFQNVGRGIAGSGGNKCAIDRLFASDYISYSTEIIFIFLAIEMQRFVRQCAPHNSFY